MKIAFTEEQLALRWEVRAYLEDLMTPALREELEQSGHTEGGGPEFRKALKRLGRDGWISLSWPEELGGKGATPMEQYIFTEEVMRTGFPYPFLTTEAIGPVLAQHASEEIKETVVKGILRGEVVIAIGYSEPNAGTDLAALTTKAEKQGSEWVLNGQKIFTSLADFSDYIWVAARTDPDAPKHRGISVFLVPNDAVGVSISPIWTMSDVRTNTTYYEDVHVSEDHLIGGLNNGWALITGQLNRERLSLVNHGPVAMLYERTVHWAADTRNPDGTRVIDQPWVQINLAKVKTGLEALKLLCWKQAWAMTEGTLQMADASVAKVYGTEFFIEAYRLLLEVMGQAGTLKKGAPGATLQGALEHRYRVGSMLTFGGGTNEVQREIIAAAGLRMPRGR